MKRFLFLSISVFIWNFGFSQNITQPQKPGSVNLNPTLSPTEVAWPDATVVYQKPFSVKYMQTNDFYLRTNDVVAEKNTDIVLYPNEYIAFELNTNDKSINIFKPDYSLSKQANDALNRAPKWLYNDLIVKFRLLNKYGYDDEYANLINTCDERVVDEVAFQVAHMPVQSLIDSRFRVRMNMLVSNADMIYNTVDSLQYVRLKEYGAFGNKDFYTVTEYRIENGKNSGDFIWQEIPRDIYYWYIVHPKVFHEGVYELDKTNSSSQRTYGYFWREYIWYNPDPNHDYTKVNKTTAQGTVSTIPRFGELIQQPDVMWDRDKGFMYFNRPFGNNDHALDLIGNWASKAIPVDAKNPRAVQPNQALYEHNGNCGEDSYLLVAACRTALIPCITMNTSGEDHVWGGIWDEDKWNHFEFFRGGLANSGWGFTSFFEDGSYESSGWKMSYVMLNRPDGYKMPWTKAYTETAFIKLKVTDKNGMPIDGAKVVLWCKPGPYYNTGWQKAGYIWTDHTGALEIEVGDYKAYGFQIDHPDFGMIPSTSTLYPFNNSQNLVRGQTYEGTIPFENAEMPISKVKSSTSFPDKGSYGVMVDFRSNQLLNGTSGDDVQDGQFLYKESGALQFFICDENNFNKFKNGEEYHVYENIPYLGGGKFNLPLPVGGKWFVVFSNTNKTVNYENMSVRVGITQDAQLSDIKKTYAPDQLKIYPNPFSEILNIELPENTTRVEVLDMQGRLVDIIENNANSWTPESVLPSGLYNIRIQTGKKIITKKVNYIKH
jgi:hypothetical protein